MQCSDMWQVFHLLFIPTLLYVSVAVIIVFIVARVVSKLDGSDNYVLIFTFGLLGGILGITSGASRTPVVGDILPALLTFVIALLTYIFSKESLSKYRVVIPYCIIAFLLTSYFGLIAGSSIIRKRYEDFQREYEKRFIKYKNVELEVEKEKEFNKLKIEFEKEKLKISRKK